MQTNKNNRFKGLLLMILCTALYTNGVVADDDVAALVVDNGPTVSAPEPGTWSLLLGGAIALSLVGRRKNKQK